MSSGMGEPYRMSGPSALAGGWTRFTHLTVLLALTDWRLRFFGSALGYLWQLVRPLMLFGVLYLVFTQFVKVGGRVPFYPVVLLGNIVLFTLCSIVARGGRFFVLAVLLNRYGDVIRSELEKRLGLWVAIGAVVLVGGFYIAYRLL